MTSPFKISVITDEISQDFGHALEVASQDFGMRWVELRGLWDKNIMALDAKEIAEARRLLERYHLRVSDLATPLAVQPADLEDEGGRGLQLVDLLSNAWGTEVDHSCKTVWFRLEII